MCGRYALYGPHSRLRAAYDTVDWPEFPDRYNIAPSVEAPVIRQSPEGARVAQLLRWGLVPHWAKDPAIGAKLNNARAESAAQKPSFRNALQKRRCLVPACGIYEWQDVPGARKQPWYLCLASGEPMALAGLWESWRDGQGGVLRSFCVLTTHANATMAPIHERMPVILARADWARWLDPAQSEITDLLRPAPDDVLRAWPVDRAVSNARNEGEVLISPCHAQGDIT